MSERNVAGETRSGLRHSTATQRPFIRTRRYGRLIMAVAVLTLAAAPAANAQPKDPLDSGFMDEIVKEMQEVLPAADKEVREIQRLLRALGYEPGPVNGVFRRETADAIRAYEAAAGLPQTGEPSSALLDELRNAENRRVASATAIRKQHMATLRKARNSRLASAKAPPDSAQTQQAAASSGGPPSADALQFDPAVKRLGGRVVVKHERGYLTSANHEALSEWLDLVAVSLSPGALRTDPVCWAVEYLPESRRRKYVSKDSAARLTGVYFKDNTSYYWASTDGVPRSRRSREERQALEKFLKNETQSFVERSIKFPIEVVWVDKITISADESEIGKYQIENLNQGTHSFLDGVRGKCIETPFIIQHPYKEGAPSFRMDPAKLEAVLQKSPQRNAYLAVVIELHTWGAYKNGAYVNWPQLWASVKSEALYEDPDLRRRITSLPFEKVREGVLLTGIPDDLGYPEQVLFGEDSIFDRLLKDHGNIFSGGVWQKLVLEKWSSDDEHWRRVSRYFRFFDREPQPYDTSYVPFFPKGFRTGKQRAIPPELMPLFQSWRAERAAHLPETLVLRAPGRTHRREQWIAEQMRVSGKHDDALAVKTLTSEGVERGRIKLIGTGSGLLSEANSQHSLVMVFPKPVSTYVPELPDNEPELKDGTPEFHILVESTRISRLKDGSRAIILRVAPQRLEIWNPGRTELLYRREF